MPISKQQICFNLSVKRKKPLPITIQIIDIIENHKPLTELRNDQSINIQPSLCMCTLLLQDMGNRVQSGEGAKLHCFRPSMIMLWEEKLNIADAATPSVVHWPAIGASPGSLIDKRISAPPLHLLSQTCILRSSPGDGCVWGPPLESEGKGMMCHWEDQGFTRNSF